MHNPTVESEVFRLLFGKPGARFKRARKTCCDRFRALLNTAPVFCLSGGALRTHDGTSNVTTVGVRYSGKGDTIYLALRKYNPGLSDGTQRAVSKPADAAFLITVGLRTSDGRARTHAASTASPTDSEEP